MDICGIFIIITIIIIIVITSYYYASTDKQWLMATLQPAQFWCKGVKGP